MRGFNAWSALSITTLTIANHAMRVPNINTKGYKFFHHANCKIFLINYLKITIKAIKI
jgi:hypothetical protein